MKLKSLKIRVNLSSAYADEVTSILTAFFKFVLIRLA